MTAPTTFSTTWQSLNRLIILTLLYLLTCSAFPAPFTATASPLSSPLPSADITVAVNGPLAVERGGQSVIHSHQLINISTSSAATAAAASTCSITYLSDAGNHCGTVWPETTTCNHTKGPRPTYTHYGCHNQYETLHFRIVHSNNDNDSNVTAFIAEFSLSVHIVPSETFPLLELSTAVANDTTNEHSVTVHCPPQYIGHCWYSIQNGLPQQADIKDNGVTGRPIPCGQSPKHQFIYRSTNTTTSVLSNAISIETGCITTAAINDQHHYNVLIVDSETSHHSEPLRLPNSFLIITEFATTPLTVDTLGGSIEDHGLPQTRNLKLTFPVLPIGGLYPSYSAKQGFLDTTVFTYSDLEQGLVSFVPDETSAAAYIPTKLQYHYYVSDFFGQILAKGILEVTVSPRLGLKPSIRRNLGFSLFANETAEINQDHLNFYPPSECLSYVMNIVKLPLWGDLYFSNNTRPLEIGNQLSITGGNLLLRYTHRKHVASYDIISTTITCPKKEPFNVTLPVRIISPDYAAPPTDNIVYNCSQTLYGYRGFVTPLTAATGQCVNQVISANVSSASIISHGSLPYLVFVDKKCNNTRFHSYPYINQSEYGLDECFLGITSQQLDNDQLSRLWYHVPLNGNHSNSSTLLISYDNGISLLVIYNVITLSTTSLNDFKQLANSEKLNYTHTNPPQPYLRRNIQLPLHTSDPVLITSHFLYVQSLGYLQSEIMYQIVTPPEHGLVCLLYHSKTCSESVRNFTQEDILSDQLYYKPLIAENDSMTTNENYMDKFVFEVYYMTDVKLNTDNQFKLQLLYLQDKESVVNQFWVRYGKTKALLRKHLKHLKHPSTPLSQLNFTLLEQPALGYVDMTEFTWQDIVNRKVKYHHKQDRGGCSDQILLTVKAKEEIFEASIVVAIRNKTKSNDVGGGAKQHKLDEGESFTLSVNDLPIKTGFCPEFVRVSIKRPPYYGLLIIQDPAYHTKRFLSANASFLLSDVIEGHISYQLQPDTVIIEDVKDELLFSVADPRGIFEDSSIMKRDTTTDTDVFHLLILVVPIEGSGLAFEFNISSTVSKQVVELENNKYGAVLDSSDLYLTNSDLLPSEVHFIVHELPQYGQLQKNNYPIEDFTLADVNSGNISYISTLPHLTPDVMQDEFRYSIHIELFDTNRRISLDNGFQFNWCYFTVDSTYEFNITEETTPTTSFTIRKIGTTATSFDASVNVVTVSGDNHTIGINCTDMKNTPAIAANISNTDSALHPDYCLLNQKLNFKGKSTKQRVSVTILDDNVPEGLDEAIDMRLTQPVGCIVPKLMNKMIHISDQEDYSHDVGFSDDYIFDKSNGPPSFTCPMQILVAEGIGTFNLTLARSENLAFRLGVICYTAGNHHDDYVLRSPTDSQSMVYFQPGERETFCPITIIEDNLNEVKEQFYVNLKIPETEFGFPNHVKDSLCVYIDHDEADEPVVSLYPSVIRVQENLREPVTTLFTITRSGADLRDETNVGCVITSTGNATEKDYMTEGLLYTPHSIPPEAKEVRVSITILNNSDNDDEGPKNFKIQLTDPFNGALDKNNPTLLEVIILPAKKDVIGFSSDEFVFNETSTLVQVPFYRHGNLAYSATVHCNNELITLDSDDVFILTSEEVIFAPNITKGACNFLPRDDAILEGTEILKITLTTNDPYIELGKSTTIVKIVDYEDALYVGLTKPVQYVREPLSNHPIDLTSVKLKVVVNEDTQINTTICYGTLNGTAKSGIHYQYSEGQLFIPANADFIELSVNIFSERSSNINKWFTVSLYPCRRDDNIILAPYNTTRVVIKKFHVGGAFFPTQPVIKTLTGDDIIEKGGHLVTSYTKPLICVTSCDSNHSDYQQNIKKCTQQDINPLSTNYKWEWSNDSINFHLITQDTILTKANTKVLQPPYFRKGVWLRCKTQAVDNSGIRGYTRTSLPLLLDLSTEGDQCQERDIEAHLNSYEGYQGRPEDLLHLSVSVPHRHNSFPVITTSPPFNHAHSLLTSSPTQTKYPCSTVSHYHEFLPLSGLSSLVSDEDRYSLLSKQFFDSYNSTSCSWTFSMWFTLKTLKNHCSADASVNGLAVNLTLYAQYVQIVNNTIVSIDHTPLIQAAPVSFTAVPVTPINLSFNYHPVNYSSTKPLPPHLLYPVALSYELNQIQLIVQSLTTVGGDHGNDIIIESSYVIHHGNIHEHGPGHLISTVSTLSIINQTWLIETELPNHFKGMDEFSIEVIMKSCPLHLYLDGLENIISEPAGCSTDQVKAVSYYIPLTLDNTGGINMAMKAIGHARETTSYIGIEGSRMIEISVSLDPSLIPISPDPRLTLTKVLLCNSSTEPSLENRGCSKEQDITGLLEAKDAQDPLNLLFHVDRSHTISHQSPSTIKWYFRLTLSFKADSSSSSISSYIWLPFQPAATLTNPSEEDPASSSSNKMPVYATVLISMMFVVLVVVMVITGLIICYSLGRKYNLKKLELEAAIQEAKCSIIETERQRLKEQNRQITSYKKRRDERRYQQRCLLLERNQLTMPDNSKDGNPSSIQHVSTDNNMPPNNSLRSSSGIQLSELSSLFPNNRTLSETTPNHSRGSNEDSSMIYNNSTCMTKEKATPDYRSSKSAAPITALNPLSTIKSLPHHTLSTLLPLNKPPHTSSSSIAAINQLNNIYVTNGDKTSSTQSTSSSNSQSTCGWYDRHLARKKAMHTYVELYLGSKAPSRGVTTPINKQQNEDEPTVADKTVAMATTTALA